MGCDQRAGVKDLHTLSRETNIDPFADEALHLRLVLETVGCEECILPPELLRETINDSLQRRIVGEFELVLDDPRQ